MKSLLKKRADGRGIITVMVCMLMIPIVVITGTLVDVSRMQMYSSQAAMASDAQAEAVLTAYDNVLKDIYGLYAVTQEDTLATIASELATGSTLSFNPVGDDKGQKIISGGLFTAAPTARQFMPYANIEVEFETEAVDGATLSNPNVLMTQISKFMQYRIVQSLLNHLDILENLSGFEDTEDENKCADQRKALTDKCEDLMEAIQNYYYVLRDIKEYPEFIKEREQAYKAYVDAVKAKSKEEKYTHFWDITQNKEAYEEALRLYRENEEIKKRNEKKKKDEEKEELNELTEKQQDYVDWYLADNNIANYGNSIPGSFTDLKKAATSNATTTGKKIDITNAESKLNDLKTKAEKVDKEFKDFHTKLTEYENSINEVDDAEMKQRMLDEITRLREIDAARDDFMAMYDYMETQNHDIQKNKDNKESIKTHTDTINGYVESMKKGQLQPGSIDSVSNSNLSLQWKSFFEKINGNNKYTLKTESGYEQAVNFYDLLDNLFNESSTSDGKKKADAKKDEAKKSKEESEAEMKKNEDEEKNMGLRDITPFASELEVATSSEKELKGFTDYMSSGLSFDSLKSMGTQAMARFMVVDYNFEMFTSRVTGIQPPDDSKKDGEASSESESTPSTEVNKGEYKEYTLTRIEKCRDVNYLYKAEMEYLVAGKDKSSDNLAYVRNLICGILTGANFIATFRISAINEAINAVAESLSALTGPFAPVTYVLISGALRLAAAAMMTLVDWTTLKMRGNVVVLKSSVMDLGEGIKEKLESLIGKDLGDGDGEGKLKMNYEHFILIFMLLAGSNSTLMDRTADLITLNMNQAKTESGKTMSKLNFKMTNAVTAVKSTCKVKSDFVIVPDYMAERFLSNETEATIQALENRTLGYSVIRGY